MARELRPAPERLAGALGLPALPIRVFPTAIPGPRRRAFTRAGRRRPGAVKIAKDLKIGRASVYRVLEAAPIPCEPAS
jgi:hypothetical protein